MASKRKKFRPTKIAMGEKIDVDDEDHRFELDEDEDPLTRIQRFIEEESEDTPDACPERVRFSPVKSWSPVKRWSEEVKRILEPDDETSLSTLTDDLIPLDSEFPNVFTNGHVPANLQFHQLIKDDVSGEFPNAFTNGQVPANLQFHQLMKDEIESLQRKADIVSPEMKLMNQVADAFIIEDDALEDLPPLKGHGERIHLKPARQLPLPKKSSAKRAKVTDDNTPRYSCTTCKYVTNRSDHFKRHLMTHSADKPLKCAMCSYSTGRSDHYKRHLQRHGLSDKDIIETCARNGLKLKSTSLSARLKSESLSALSDASNGTKNTDNMQVTPKQSNPGEKPTEGTGRKRYKCPSCTYSTDKLNHYNRHQTCHSKTGLAHCGKCNKSFKSKSYFLQHKCGYLSDRRCPKCRTIYIDRNAVLLHIAREHCNDLLMLPPPPANVEDSKTNDTESNDLLDLTSAAVQVDSTSAVAQVDSTSAVEQVDLTGETLLKNESIDLTQTDSRDKSPDEQTDEGKSAEVIVIADTPTNSQEKSQSPDKKEQGSESAGFVPKMTAAQGNLGCTKCGGWFNKLNEYSSHVCVS